jgi:hypothetical protein
MCCNEQVNIDAVNNGSSVPDPRVALPLPELATLHRSSHPSPPVLPEDSVSASLAEITAPPLRRLLQIVEHRLAALPQATARAQTVPTASTDVNREVNQGDAERSVARAVHAMETAGSRAHRIPPGVDPQIVLALANRFIETGQPANYFRAAELGREVRSWYAQRDDEASPALSVRELQLRSRSREALRRMWRRAPLLIMLTAWMAAGVLAALLPGVPGWAFNVWALGFLAMVVFQFAVVTMRGASR